MIGNKNFPRKLSIEDFINFIFLLYFIDNMSQDSLINDEQDANNCMPQSSSPPNGVNRKCSRSNNLDEHIKLVKQKKEEADVLRLQKFQEQLRKKEQKW
jgi:hypothetical protein